MAKKHRTPRQREHHTREGDELRDKDEFPLSEEKKYRRNRVRKGNEAFREARVGRKEIERARTRAHEVRRQIRDEGLDIDPEFLQEFLTTEIDYLKRGGKKLEGTERLQLQREYRQRNKAMKSILRRHVDLNEEALERKGEINRLNRELDYLLDLDGEMDPEELVERLEDIQEELETIHKEAEEADAARRDLAGDMGRVSHGPEGGAAAAKRPKKDPEEKDEPGTLAGGGATSRKRTTTGGGGTETPTRKPNTAPPEAAGGDLDGEVEAAEGKRLEQEKAAAKLKKEKLNPLLADGKKAIDAYEKNVADLKAKMTPIDSVIPSVGAVQLGFAGPFKHLDGTVASLRSMHADIKKDIDGITRIRSDKEAKEQVKAIQEQVDALKARITTDEEAFQAYRDHHVRAEEVGAKVVDHYNRVRPLMSVPDFDIDYFPEAQFVILMKEDFSRAIERFNHPEVSIEQQEEVLKELEQKVEEYKDDVQAIATIVEKVPVVMEQEGQISIRNLDLAEDLISLETIAAGTPKAWGEFWGPPGKQRYGFLSRISSAYDKTRDNLYHARLFGAGNIDAFDFSEEIGYIEGLDTEITGFIDEFETATTPEERVKILEAFEKRLKELANDSKLAEIERTIQEKMEEAQNAGYGGNDCWTGRAVGWLGGDIEDMERGDWAVGGYGFFGRTGRYLAQYGVGLSRGVEDLGKWVVGMGVGGTVGMAQTAPQMADALLVKRSWKEFENVLNNNTASATTKTFTLDVGKSVIAGLGAIAGGTVNAVRGRGFTPPAWTERWAANENNNLTAAARTLGRGIWDWGQFIPAGVMGVLGKEYDTPDTAGNGVHLGETVALVVSAMAGGAAIGGAGSIEGGLAVRGARLGRSGSPMEALTAGNRWIGREAMTQSGNRVIRVRATSRPVTVGRLIGRHALAIEGAEAAGVAAGAAEVSGQSTAAEIAAAGGRWRLFRARFRENLSNRFTGIRDRVGHRRQGAAEVVEEGAIAAGEATAAEAAAGGGRVGLWARLRQMGERIRRRRGAAEVAGEGAAEAAETGARASMRRLMEMDFEGRAITRSDLRMMTRSLEEALTELRAMTGVDSAVVESVESTIQGLAHNYGATGDVAQVGRQAMMRRHVQLAQRRAGEIVGEMERVAAANPAPATVATGTEAVTASADAAEAAEAISSVRRLGSFSLEGITELDQLVTIAERSLGQLEEALNYLRVRGLGRNGTVGIEELIMDIEPILESGGRLLRGEAATLTGEETAIRVLIGDVQRMGGRIVTELEALETAAARGAGTAAAGVEGASVGAEAAEIVAEVDAALARAGALSRLEVSTIASEQLPTAIESAVQDLTRAVNALQRTGSTSELIGEAEGLTRVLRAADDTATRRPALTNARELAGRLESELEVAATRARAGATAAEAAEAGAEGAAEAGAEVAAEGGEVATTTAEGAAEAGAEGGARALAESITEGLSAEAMEILGSDFASLTRMLEGRTALTTEIRNLARTAGTPESAINVARAYGTQITEYLRGVLRQSRGRVSTEGQQALITAIEEMEAIGETTSGVTYMRGLRSATHPLYRHAGEIDAALRVGLGELAPAALVVAGAATETARKSLEEREVFAPSDAWARLQRRWGTPEA